MHDKNSTLAALSAAAMLLNGVSGAANANPPDQKVAVDYRYTSYNEGDIDSDSLAEGSESRYRIDIHQFKLKTPVAEDTELTFTGTQEAMSGASPWYVLPDAEGKPVQVMSGATIDEARTELNIDFRSYNEKSESTLSLSHSSENDYRSFAFGYAGQWRLNHNLTNFNYGLNATQDYINASDADIYPGRPTDETKIRIGGFLGFSHVMTKNRLIGFTVSASSLEGYLSDAYKLAWVVDTPVQDARPETQNRSSAALMLRQFFNRANAALHLDLSHYQNDWEMTSETVNIGWYQNIGSSWQVTPSLRYYQQTAAIFYAPYYTNSRRDGFYSSDYRLSEFSSISASLKVSKTWEKYAANFLYETYSATGDHPGLISFDMLSLGLSARF